jgi:hypothetical protein
MASESSVALGELRGFLSAFALVNEKVNNLYTFTIDRLPPAPDIRGALHQAFSGDLTEVTTTPVDDWHSTVRAALGRWLFEFQNPHDARLVDAQEAFTLSSEWGRERILDWAIDRLRAVVAPTVVWKTDIGTKFYGDNMRDDFVFETADGRFLLHLGVAD